MSNRTADAVLNFDKVLNVTRKSKIVNMQDLQYPIGKFAPKESYSFDEIKANIKILVDFPALLKASTATISEAALETPYRPEGWTARQVIHHIADSHANMYIRVKCALTEENPTIKGYNEGDWAKLPDSKLPIDSSLAIIEGLHQRVTSLFESMQEADFQRTFYHNGYQRTYVLANVVALYAWHSMHHLKHIEISIAAAKS